MVHIRFSTPFVPALLIGALLLSGSLFSCGDDVLTDPKQIVFPDTNVSYQRHVQPFLNLTCTYSGCHSSDSRAGNLALTTYMEFIDSPGLIVEGKPESSVLSQVLEGKLPHSVSFTERITQNHIDGVRQWIKEGAQNN